MSRIAGPTELIARWSIGLSWTVLWWGLAYSAICGSQWATLVFCLLSFASLCGAVSLCRDVRPHRRSSLPAWLSFPSDMALTVFCVVAGGWLAVAGMAVVATALLELIVFDDLKLNGE